MLLGVATVVVALSWAVAGGRGLDPRLPVVRWLPVGVVGVVGQVAITGSGLVGEQLVAAEVVSLAALVATCLVNTHLPGAPALAAGVLANAIAILANAGMPVSGDAVAALGGVAASVPDAGPHHLLDAGTTLPVLADTLAIPWVGIVVSPGDALLVVGAVACLSACLLGDVDRRRDRSEVRRGRSPGPTGRHGPAVVEPDGPGVRGADVDAPGHGGSRPDVDVPWPDTNVGTRDEVGAPA